MSQPSTFTDLQLFFLKKKCKGFNVFKQWVIYTIEYKIRLNLVH